MAVHLPAPMNKILSLRLPPDFKESEENTLGHVFKQDTLTWEALVKLLHIFCENLLVPCSYPNPMPPLERFDHPVPSLSSHYPPHVIYTFCVAIYNLMRRIQPEEHLDTGSTTRWGLMQKTPQGEYFSSPADLRVEDAMSRRLNIGTTVLETLAARGDSFGSAMPMTVQSTLASASRPTRTLSESLVRKASLKMGEWKQKRATGGFGSIVRGVTPIVNGWTPSFAPTYDSVHTVGLGFTSTIDAAYERAWHRRWACPEPPANTGWWGSTEEQIESVDQSLEDNSSLIEELQEWQAYRVRANLNSPTERELLAADQLLNSLAKLAGQTTPVELAGRINAHKLAQSVIPTSAPSIRGTLDPRRPRALRDNTTSRTQPAGSSSAQVKPPSTPLRAYNSGNTVYGRSTPTTSTTTNTTAYNVRPSGPGPSNLRQSYAPNGFRPVQR
ncbi:hypothetical protein BD324DRAFT_615370 [Kockovaella imperatae]|uniref:Uncharacterized protein n=1 Tax=Kockovaella imperatae TaxID=4999 RepID=A0A1Y1UPI2_9TREE|nr:hypothetical protein BD324DRAFT_615370 [Kockovaella imperatae]ORX39882.1 hypothetical protein BD324DRAFT_615370 [Kockovaella imperatae]